MRLDLFLVKLNLAQSRSHAQALIKSGQVYQEVNGEKVYFTKANHSVDAEQKNIFVIDGPANRFVSRGGLKLEGALEHVGLNPRGFRVLDIGISTGGFTDCILQAGAKQVVGVDVGHGQTHPTLLGNPRLEVIEGLNARELGANERMSKYLTEGGFDLVVMDVSFISGTLVIPLIPQLLRLGGSFLGLVKPQFEVGPEGLGKGGIVKDSGLYRKVEDKVRASCVNAGLVVIDYFDSPIEGKDGNREFFVFAKR